MLRLRLRHPAFPRDVAANPLELTSPSLFPRLQDVGEEGSGRSGSCLGLSPPSTAVEEGVDRGATVGDEECISVGRARSRRTRFALRYTSLSPKSCRA
jgi:hypothetical protein